MEDGDAAAAAVSSEKQEEETAPSYRYWVREKTQEAAPLPVPKKLTAEDISNQSNQSSNLGSAWNRAGTWEETNLTSWATNRLMELFMSVGSMDFSGGKAEISQVTKCRGEAFSVFVRNKKRFGYTYDATLSVDGEWVIGSESKKAKGYIEIAEISYGEVDDLMIQVRLSSEVKDLGWIDRHRIIRDIQKFVHPLREKLDLFECEIKNR